MSKYLRNQNTNQSNKNQFIQIKIIYKMAVVNKSEIKIKVGLDENRVPEQLFWSADDGNVENMESKAVLLSVWNSEEKETFRVNLWTKDMPVNEMKQFFHQTLVSMADTYEVATGDDKMTATMRDFCDYFVENMMKS